MLKIRKYLTCLKFSSATCTRNSINKLCVNYSRTNIRKFSFSNKVPLVWNKVPELLTKAPNVNTIRNSIKIRKKDISTLIKSLRPVAESDIINILIANSQI